MKKNNKDCWQKILVHALGKEWNEERYILGYRPKPKIKYDIGFNWATGNKWMNKTWPRNCWERLESLTKNRYSISW